MPAAGTRGCCDLFGAPAGALPEIVDCAGRLRRDRPGLFGAAIPICGMAGDQQAAAIGQACLAPGETKATYGTGAFVLTHTGAAAPVSRHRLLTTVGVAAGGRAALRAGRLGVRRRQPDPVAAGRARPAGDARPRARRWRARSRTMRGVYLVPALAGLGAPHWRPEARAALTGLSFAAGRAA